MAAKKQSLVREALRKRPDGATAHELMQELGFTYKQVTFCLGAMPDVYIDRWYDRKPKPELPSWCTKESRWIAPPATMPLRGPRYIPVWAAVPTPPNCPHPVKGDINSKQ